MTCPCGTGLSFEQCCGPLLAGERQAATAISLMRARYTAYVRADIDFIMRTQESGEDADRSSTEAWSRESKWLGLEVLKTTEILVQQRIHALEAGAKITVEVRGHTPQPDLVEELEREIAARNFFLYCESQAAEERTWVQREREAVAKAAKAKLDGMKNAA